MLAGRWVVVVGVVVLEETAVVVAANVVPVAAAVVVTVVSLLLSIKLNARCWSAVVVLNADDDEVDSSVNVELVDGATVLVVAGAVVDEIVVGVARLDVVVAFVVAEVEVEAGGRVPPLAPGR